MSDRVLKINRKLEDQFLTVAELRDLLEGLEDEAYVGFVSDYGDIGNTQQFLPFSIAEPLDSSCLAKTGYSNSGLELVQADDFECDEEDLDEAAAEYDSAITIIALQ